MHLNDKISLALDKWERNVRTSAMATEAQKDFAVIQTRKIVNDLVKIAETIRDNINLTKGGDWRTSDGIIQDLLAIGQRYTSYLFSFNLRDSVTDVVEAYYGIGFNALKVYPAFRNKQDNSTVFLLYRESDYNRGDKISYLENGQWKYCSTNEFKAMFEPV